MKPKQPNPNTKKTKPTEVEWVRGMLIIVFFTVFLNLVITCKILEIISGNQFDVPFF